MNEELEKISVTSAVTLCPLYMVEGVVSWNERVKVGRGTKHE